MGQDKGQLAAMGCVCILSPYTLPTATEFAKTSLLSAPPWTGAWEHRSPLTLLPRAETPGAEFGVKQLLQCRELQLPWLL